MLLVGFDSAAAFSSSEVSMSTAIGFSRVPSLKHGATTDAAERVSTCVGPPLPWSIAGSLVPVVWLHHALLVLHHHLLLVVVIVDLDHWSPAMPPMTTRNRSGVFGAVRRTTAHSFTSSGCSRQARRPPCSCLIKEGAERLHEVSIAHVSLHQKRARPPYLSCPQRASSWTSGLWSQATPSGSPRHLSYRPRPRLLNHQQRLLPLLPPRSCLARLGCPSLTNNPGATAQHQG